MTRQDDCGDCRRGYGGTGKERMPERENGNGVEMEMGRAPRRLTTILENVVLVRMIECRYWDWVGSVLVRIVMRCNYVMVV